MTVKCLGETQKKRQESYIPHKLRSRPLRCISLPLFCLLLFIVYWFLMCPLIFVGVEKQCKTQGCNWPKVWPYYFWTVALLVFIFLLAIALCLWCCKPVKELPEKVKERQKEYDKLLTEAMDYNSLRKKEVYKEKPMEEVILLKTITEIEERKPESSKTDLELVKIEVKNKPKVEITKTKPEPNKTDLELKPLKAATKLDEPIITKESMVEEIDKLFPRCSIRRRDFKRPDSLILQSPKYPKDVSKFRHTVVEETKSLSPLSPRDLFFFDLAKAAHEKMVSTTEKFIENERKHSSNMSDRSSKPEIKSFVLKRKSELNSPEYFIANVSGNRLSTSEVFMYVDGGQPEEALTICYLDTDDEVFKE